MTNQEIITELQEHITLLYNCTDDAEMKAKLRRIKSGFVVERVKCPRCGSKFTTHDNMKFAVKIL